MNPFTRLSACHARMFRLSSRGLKAASHIHLPASLHINGIRTARSTSTNAKNAPTPPKDLAAKANSLTNTPRAVQYLGYGGALPFIAGALVSTVTSDPYPFARATQLYASSILSFLGAVHWGVGLRAAVDGIPGTRDFIYGVTPSLVAWAAAMMQPSDGLLVLTGGLGAAFFYDTIRFGMFSGVPAWYRRLRLPLSVAAVGGCAVTLVAVRRENGTEQLPTPRSASNILSTSALEGGASTPTENQEGGS